VTEPARSVSRQHTTTILLLIWCGLVVLLWMMALTNALHLYGLFGKVGKDYGAFWAAGRALVHMGPASIYDLKTIDHFAGPVMNFHGTKGGAAEMPPGLYPVPFFALVVPFSFLAPAPSFVIWSVIQFAIAAYVAVRLSRRFNKPSPMLTGALLLFFPIPIGLYFGQATIILLFAVLQAYEAFERGDDGRAGMWLAVLFLKPQYAIAFPLIFLYKRRWRAFAGITTIASAIGLTSLLMMGEDGIRNYMQLSKLYTGFHSAHSTIYPSHMMNWHSILINLLPNLSDHVGVALTWLMAALSFALLPLVWRGAWIPRSARFAEQMLVTMIIVLMASFHTYTHGAVLLLVPGVAIMAYGGRSWTLRTTLKLGLIAIPLVHFGVMIAIPTDAYATVVPLVGVALCLIASAAILIHPAPETAVIDDDLPAPSFERSLTPSSSPTS
jgi:hypothetical protein